MKTAIIFTLLTILGSLCQGKPVDKKKKLKDQSKQGKISILDLQLKVGIKGPPFSWV